MKDKLQEPTEFKMDGYLKDNLEIIYDELRDDYDAFILVTGRERFGKSTLAGQIAYFLDRSYNLDRCVFTPEQYFKAINETKEPYKAIVFDEASSYLNVRKTMSSGNIVMNKMMAEIGFRNLIHILVMPSYFELDKYPALHRAVCLIWVEARGIFKAFSYYKKWELWFEGKKKNNMYAVTPDFYGRFSKWMPYDREEYKKKKYESVMTSLEVKRKITAKERYLEMAVLKMRQKGMTIKQIESNFGIPNQRVSEILALAK